MPRPRRRQDVQPLNNEDVRAADHHFLAGNDVIGDMRVPGRPDFLRPALDLADEPQQRPAVVGLREALAFEQLPALELGQRVQEPVGGDQLNVGRAGPAPEHLASTRAMVDLPTATDPRRR